MAADEEGRGNMQTPERDAPATDWSKMFQPFFRCQVPREDQLRASEPISLAKMGSRGPIYQKAGFLRDETQEILTAVVRASKSPNAMPCQPNEY
jgi:hypothetical protein